MERELQMTQALAALLQREQQCLVEADTEGLLALLEQKWPLVAGIAQLADARLKAMLAAGHPASAAGMAAWLDGGAQATELGAAWQQLTALARAAQETNRVNGLLIRRHLQGKRAALAALRGAPAHGAVYGPNGQTLPHGTPRARAIG